MTDTLRTRIAIIQQGHIFCITECSCGHRFAVSDTSHTAPFADWKTDAEWEWAQHVADAVIRELGLKRENDDEIPPFWPTQGEYRYVTDWTAKSECYSWCSKERGHDGQCF